MTDATEALARWADTSIRANGATDSGWQRHRDNCRCPLGSYCVRHGAAEWGGGEPDVCRVHPHIAQAAEAKAQAADVSPSAAADLDVEALAAGYADGYEDGMVEHGYGLSRAQIEEHARAYAAAKERT